MLRVAYLGFIQFEKLSMSYPPLLKKEKNEIKKFTGEKIILLHILTEFVFFYLFTILGFVNCFLPSHFMCKKYVSPIGFNANFDTIFQNLGIIFKKTLRWIMF